MASEFKNPGAEAEYVKWKAPDTSATKPALEMENDEEVAAPVVEQESDEIKEAIEALKAEAQQIEMSIVSDFDEKMTRTEDWASSADKNKQYVRKQIEEVNNKLRDVRGEQNYNLLSDAIKGSLDDISKNINAKIKALEAFDKLPEEKKTPIKVEDIEEYANQSLEMVPIFTSSDWKEAYTRGLSWKFLAKERIREQKRSKKV